MSINGSLTDKKTHLSHIFYHHKMRLWQKSQACGLHLDTQGHGL
ncbi:hypothetical protein SOHN41_00076 [Shewanella sp. HN-41]|nr:hypothetical protein SOHN41_00076 [Shewanella sp. HN-41]